MSELQNIQCMLTGESNINLYTNTDAEFVSFTSNVSSKKGTVNIVLDNIIKELNLYPSSDKDETKITKITNDIDKIKSDGFLGKNSSPRGKGDEKPLSIWLNSNNKDQLNFVIDNENDVSYLFQNLQQNVYTENSSSTTISLNDKYNIHYLVAENKNYTISLQNVDTIIQNTDSLTSLSIYFIVKNNTSNTFTWDNNIKWNNDKLPEITNEGVDIYKFSCYDISNTTLTWFGKQIYHSIYRKLKLDVAETDYLGGIKLLPQFTTTKTLYQFNLSDTYTIWTNINKTTNGTEEGPEDTSGAFSWWYLSDTLVKNKILEVYGKYYTDSTPKLLFSAKCDKNIKDTEFIITEGTNPPNNSENFIKAIIKLNATNEYFSFILSKNATDTKLSSIKYSNTITYTIPYQGALVLNSDNQAKIDMSYKQDKLVAGNHIKIDQTNNTISCSLNEYNLPIATTSTLGGIIVGDNLTVTDTGILSVNDSSIQKKLTNGSYISIEESADSPKISVTNVSDTILSGSTNLVTSDGIFNYIYDNCLTSVGGKITGSIIFSNENPLSFENSNSVTIGYIDEDTEVKSYIKINDKDSSGTDDNSIEIVVQTGYDTTQITKTFKLTPTGECTWDGNINLTNGNITTQSITSNVVTSNNSISVPNIIDDSTATISLDIDSSCNDNMVISKTGVTLNIKNGSSSEAWTKHIAFTEIATLNIETDWYWENNKTQTIEENSVLTASWNGAFGILSLQKTTS